MAVSLLEMHQIFMLAFAGLKVEGEEAQVLVVSQPPPLVFLVFILSSQAWFLKRAAAAKSETAAVRLGLVRYCHRPRLFAPLC